jgi:membrane protein YdbS with pleckstrin-like domain
MYSVFRQLAEKWLRIPPEPEPPPGDEATARVFRAAPNFLKYLRLLWAIQNAVFLIAALISLVVVGFVLSRENLDPAVAILVGLGELIIITVLVVQALFQLAMVQLDYEKRWYVVTNRSLRIREGVGTVREITFTFANIQNLSVTQGPIQRILGIADLKVETAGGGSTISTQQQQAAGMNLHTAYFRGIDNAEEIKQLVADRMRGYRDSGLGDHDDHGVPLPAPVAPSSASDSLGEALAAVLAEAKLLRGAAER